MTSEEYVNVPLVIYVDGVRHVIGEAVVKGDRIEATLGDEPLAREVLDMLQHPTSSFSISYDTVEARANAQPKNIEPLFRIPERITDNVKLTGVHPIIEKYRQGFDEIERMHSRRPIDLSEIPFPPDQRARPMQVKEPNWWEGLEMDPERTVRDE